MFASAMTFANPSCSPWTTAFGDRRERHLADLRLKAPFLALLLGEADRPNLRARVRGARLVYVVHRMDVPVARDRVDGREALMCSGVGKPQPADDIADRHHVRFGRPHVPVDFDDPLVDNDPGRLEAQVLDVRGAPCRDEQALGRDLPGLASLRTDGQAECPRR